MSSSACCVHFQHADGALQATELPHVVLDQVLAGALKDNRRALVAGERTFGKGLIQTVVELSDGSAVAVTVSRCARARVCSTIQRWPARES